MIKRFESANLFVMCLVACLFVSEAFAQWPSATPIPPGSRQGSRDKYGRISVVPTVFQVGHVFAAVGNGRYFHYNGSGVLLDTLVTGLGGFTTGMAFDAAGNFYGTNFSVSNISRFTGPGIPHTHSVFATGDPGGACESIVRDTLGNFFVGQAGGTFDILKFNSAGTRIDNFDVPVGPRGSDWIDLGADQRTMFYTSEGTTVRRYDLVTRTALSDFSTALTGGASYALRLLPGGGMLVANSTDIKRLNAAGAVIQTYDATGANSWFALNLDPDGTSFWSGSFDNNAFYKFDIATGALLLGPIATGGALFGLAVFGELTVGVCAGNVPPAFVSPTPSCGSTLQATVGTPFTFTVRGTDANASNQVTMTVTNLPSGSTMTPPLPTIGNPVQSVFNWTPTSADLGLRTIVYRLADACTTISCTLNVNVTAAAGNLPPEFVSPTPTCGTTLTANTGQAFTFTVRASDPNTGNTVTLSSSALPVGATMTPALPTNGNPVQSVFNWTPGAGQTGLFTIIYTATDNATPPAAVQCTLRVNVGSNDVTAPSCAVTQIIPGPPKQIIVTTQDLQSGLASIVVVTATNATVSIPSFTVGTTSPVVVTATKTNQSLPSTVVLRVRDVAGNETVCDPVYTTISARIPDAFALGTNYPNPFNPATKIKFNVARTEAPTVVTLTVYDVLGREVKQLINEPMQAGEYFVEWDGTDAHGKAVTSGVYITRMTAGDFVATQRMALMK